MKVLSQKEVKNVELREKERVDQIDEYLSKRTKELNDLKIVYAGKKKKLVDDFLDFESRFKKKTEELNRQLENPDNADYTDRIINDTISAFYKEAEERLTQAKTMEEASLLRVSDASKVEKECNKKTDDLNILSGELKTKEEKLDYREKETKRKETEIDNKLSSYTTNRENWEEEKRKKDREMEARAKSLELAIKSNVLTKQELADSIKRYTIAYESALQMREEYIQKKRGLDDEFEKQKRIIAEERSNLDIAWREMERIKNQQ